MPPEIEISERPGKRGIRLEDVLRRIQPCGETLPATDPELDSIFEAWQEKWLGDWDQVTRRLELLASALGEESQGNVEPG